MMQGNKTGKCICIDLSPIKPIMHDEYRESMTPSGKGLTAAYHRFEVEKKAICCQWRNKLYVWNGAFFGGKTMTTAFPRMIDAIVREVDFPENLAAYLDDFRIKPCFYSRHLKFEKPLLSHDVIHKS
jgi:hypothetical protein